MELMELLPVQTNRSIIKAFSNIVDAQFVEENYRPSIKKQFIEANTQEVTLSHLKDDCIIPVFSKDNETTISHPNFIDTVWQATNKFFPNENILEPEIKVSHVVKGRVPDAIHKPTNQLLDADKTIYYERMAFCIEVPSICEEIEGSRLNLTIGGVRAYNHENLYSKKGVEKFKVFIGFKNLVCCNLCISTDGLQKEIKVMSELELLKAMITLFQQYNIQQHFHLMKTFKDFSLSEHQFAQLIGKTKLYHCLPNPIKKNLPTFEFGDSHINAVAKAYYNDESFKCDAVSKAISLWKVYNLFTGANKSSYIDSLLDRSVNATELIEGISKALNGDNGYRWFID